jgi:hypothetical protein
MRGRSEKKNAHGLYHPPGDRMVQVQAIAQNTETLRLLARKRRKLMRKLEERETLSGH